MMPEACGLTERGNARDYGLIRKGHLRRLSDRTADLSFMGSRLHVDAAESIAGAAT